MGPAWTPRRCSLPQGCGSSALCNKDGIDVRHCFITTRETRRLTSIRFLAKYRRPVCILAGRSMPASRASQLSSTFDARSVSPFKRSSMEWSENSLWTMAMDLGCSHRHPRRTLEWPTLVNLPPLSHITHREVLGLQR